MTDKCAAVAFAADWPKDDWSRFKPGDHVHQRYGRIASAVIEECAGMLAREYPDNVNTNAFCAAIRSMKSKS